MMVLCGPLACSPLNVGGDRLLAIPCPTRGNPFHALGKPGPIVHIRAMSDKHDNPSDEQARPAPQYRVRMPERETSAPKSAQNAAESSDSAANADNATKPDDRDKAKEIGGLKGPEPTRFGDWERDGRCVDF